MTHPYATLAYANSLPHLGRPVEAPAWGSWMLSRPLPNGAGHDLIGPYPLAVLEPKADVQAGLDQLAATGAVCAVMVVEDSLRPALPLLEAAFDICRPFKTHYRLDRSAGDVTYDKHHRYEIRRALTKVEAREVALADHLPAWLELYGELTARRGLGGTHDFPPAHHVQMSKLEGVRTFAAFLDGRMVSAHLFVIHGGHAMSHLAASSAEGYAVGAAYAVNDLAVRSLTDCGIINFGGGAGAVDDTRDGLARFKRGFSNATAPSYLCCKVLDVEAYEALSADYERDGFFPAYRGRRRGEVR